MAAALGHPAVAAGRAAAFRGPTTPPRLRQTYRPFCSTAVQLYRPLSRILQVSEEVADAVATNQPVVALESTIYTHGALGSELLLEDIVRKHGAIPAVCGVLAGVPTVGLNPAEVHRMVSEGARKVSRRDLAYLIGMSMSGERIHGGTTIAGTMILARLAGIRVFGTGGLGGVHRGGHDSMDISADLTELGRTRVAVIASGCKGFLDIPRTLEYLETQGVLVSTFADGQTRGVDFPAFWARESGTPSPSVVRDERQAAAMILAQEQLDVESGLLFANPIPLEFAIPREDMEAFINQAVREADEQGHAGNANTPFILRRIRELTQGRSVPANKALVQANVARAAAIAVELSSLIRGAPARARPLHSVPLPIKDGISDAAKATQSVDVLVAGSIALDLNCDYINYPSADESSTAPSLHTSNPAAISQTVGGVGHNVALAAHKVSDPSKVRLCSVVGDDIAGETVMRALESSGLDTSCIRQLGHEFHSARTAQYVALNTSDKSLMIAMADMAILTSHSFPHYWHSAVASSKPKWLVIDGNWNSHDIRSWARSGRAYGAKIAFEPVSVAKSKRVFPPFHGDAIGAGMPPICLDLATPNQYEVEAMYSACLENGYLRQAETWIKGLQGGDLLGFPELGVNPSRLTHILSLLPFIPTIITKLGAHGILLTTVLKPDDQRLLDPAESEYIVKRDPENGRHGGIYVRHYPAVESVQDVVSVNGAGDTFLGVLVAGLAQGGRLGTELINIAQRAAVLTLRSRQPVSDELNSLRAGVRTAARSTS